jgi:cardiolipin synthase
VIVDDIWTSIGSTNIDDRALRLNDEANINFFDRGVAASQVEIFNKDLAASRPYTLADWQRRTANEKFSDWLATLTRSQI